MRGRHDGGVHPFADRRGPACLEQVQHAGRVGEHRVHAALEPRGDALDRARVALVGVGLVGAGVAHVLVAGEQLRARLRDQRGVHPAALGDGVTVRTSVSPRRAVSASR